MRLDPLSANWATFVSRSALFDEAQGAADGRHATGRHGDLDERAAHRRLDLDGRLLGLDGHDRIARGDRVTHGHEPRLDGRLAGLGAEVGELDGGRHRSVSGSGVSGAGGRDDGGLDVRVADVDVALQGPRHG